VIVAVDRSGSMAEQLDQIQTDLGACLQEFVDSDRVGLVSFGDDVTVDVRLGRYEGTRLPILDAIDELDTNGRTALRDAILASLEEVSGIRDPDRIAAVVVITDGDREGDPSQVGLSDLVGVLRQKEPPIRVFVVESGGRVSTATKRAIIEASQGRVFNVEEAETDPLGEASPVAQVCGEVFSYF
jgi:Ca-activated chloride channel homolog